MNWNCFQRIVQGWRGNVGADILLRVHGTLKCAYTACTFRSDLIVVIGASEGSPQVLILYGVHVRLIGVIDSITQVYIGRIYSCMHMRIYSST